MEIRNYKPTDIRYLYDICLKTGNSGKDASRMYRNIFLLGEFYAAPYVKFHPELAFILEENGIPLGYIIGTDDSIRFRQLTEKYWFNVLRDKYPYPSDTDKSDDAKIVRLIYNGYSPREELTAYPAHLHIDILPAGQGKGMGRKLIHTFINKLKELNVPALHLEVGKKNINAINFYKKTGFEQLKEYEYSIAFGLKL